MSWIRLLVTAAVSVLITPLLIRTLGDYQYGLWVLAVSLVDYFSLLDLGLPQSLQRFVPRHTAADSAKRRQELLSTTLLFSLGASVVALAALGGLLLVGPYLVNIRSSAESTFIVVIGLLGLSALTGYPTRLLSAYLCGLERFDLVSYVATTIFVARAIALMWLAHAGFGLIEMSGAVTVAALTSLALHWMLVRRIDPSVRPSVRDFDRARLAGLLRFGFYNWAIAIGDWLRLNLDYVVTARFVGIQYIAPLNLAASLIHYFKAFPTTGVAPLMPRLSRLDATNDTKTLMTTFLAASKLSATLTFYIATFLLLHGYGLLNLWVHEHAKAAYGLVLIVLPSYTLALAQVPSIALMYAGAKHRALAAWTLGEGIANVALSVYLAPHFGVAGVVMGTAIPMAITKTFIQPIFVCRLISLPLTSYVSKILGRPLLAAVLATALWHFASTLWHPGAPLPTAAPVTRDLTSFVLAVVLHGVIFTVVAAVIVPSKAERAAIAERLAPWGALFHHRVRG